MGTYIRISTPKSSVFKSRNKNVCLPFANGRLYNEDIDLLQRRFCRDVANNISDNMLKTAFKLVQ
jgi:hypothetical protein